MAAELKLKFKTALFIIIISFLIPVPSDDKYERDYMLKLMKALTPTPSDWSNNTDACKWSGVYCHPLYVNSIVLSSRSLKGTIPSGLNDSLTSLTKIDLSKNSLSGPLPSLANLQFLEEVYFNDNNFTSIPDGCFQGLVGLKYLKLENNINLSPWKFPTELTGSSNLTHLILNATNLMDFLPDIFHSFPNLTQVVLSFNNLSGVLPKSFARSKIEKLYQRNNKLSGTIEVLSSMTHLNSVWLDGNHFEGPIPDLSNCSDLVELSLQDNQLTGVVPPSLMNLSKLERVFLDKNWLQGPLPVFNNGVTVNLDVSYSNSFCLDHVGPCDQRVNTLLEIAATFGYPLLLARSWRDNNPCQNWSFITCDGSNIRTMNLTNLNLTGMISPAFGNLTSLQNLYLGGNNLQGLIPESLATLPHLQVLDVSNNNLSGNIPRFSHEVKFIATGNAFLGNSQARGTTRWIAGASIACAGAIIIFVVVIYILMKSVGVKKRASIDKKFEDFIKNYGSLTVNRYSYSEIKRMTNLFRDKLGQGGYGIVYKASLTDGREAAVKVLRDFEETSGEQFINEVATISRTAHVNIVSLLGFCYEKNKRALIYEFMPNGSLDKFLYKKGSSNVICDLGWNILFQITISIARGLEYLHRGCNTRILHLDIKPQNILLDEDFSPKISDFGLATICKKKESIVSIEGMRGTPGYIAPEVFSRTYGGVSHKSDVYSYGMLILEMVGGRKNFDRGGSSTSEIYFPDWIYKDIEQGNILSRHMVNTEDESEIVLKITLVGLWCIQPNPFDRPSMSKVLEMLEGPFQSLPYPRHILLSLSYILLKHLLYHFQILQAVVYMNIFNNSMENDFTISLFLV